MYGAMLGDIIGSPYEFDRGDKTTDFPLFGPSCTFTDDSVMTVAVAKALMDAADEGVLGDDEAVEARVARELRAWGMRYPCAGYGVRFSRWLENPSMGAYNSWGNGSAMRVSAAGWLGQSLEEVRRLARLTAAVTHNHPEGIKGAEACATVIYLGRTGAAKADIRPYIEREFGYDLSRTCDEIRPTYHHVESCQKTVPEAITCLVEGADFEGVVRLAVSLGGDTDTLACIAGSMAEAFHGVPEDLKARCRTFLTPDLLEVLDRFEAFIAAAR